MALFVSCERAVSVLGYWAIAPLVTVVLRVAVPVGVAPGGAAAVVVASVPPSRTVPIVAASVTPG